MDTTRYKSTFGFVDLLFNLLVGFTFLFVLAFILINPIAKKDVLDPKAEFLVILTWNDKSKNDIDTWIKDDQGNVVSFRLKDIALVNLDRDDRGIVNDLYQYGGGDAGTTVLKRQSEEHQVNREVTSIRSKTARTFVVTSHYYHFHSGELNDEEVTAELIKVNPYKILKRKSVILRPRQEKHMFKFEVLESGSVIFHESDELIIKNSPVTNTTYDPPDGEY